MSELKSLVTFEAVAVEDRDASEEAGRPVFKDKYMATMTIPGTSNTSIKEVDDEIKAKYPKEWEAFESGISLDDLIEGTHLKNWPAITPAMVKNCLRIGVRTVEELAVLHDQGLRSIGMGARALQQKAKLWLESANDSGKMVNEINSLKNQIEDLKMFAKEQQETIAALKQAGSEEAKKKPGRRKKMSNESPNDSSVSS